MSGPAPIFRELHRLRRFAHEMQEFIDRFPRLLKAQQGKVTRQEDAQREGQETLKKLKVHIHETEVTLKSTHAQIAKRSKQLEEATGKEYEALKNEIATSKAKTQELEDDILATMDTVETTTATLPALEKTVQTARTDFLVWEKETRARLVEQQRLLEETKAKLKEVETTIPAKFRGQYDRVVARMGHEAMAAVRDSTCTACSVAIPAQINNDLKSENFVVCRSCERILYPTEETGWAESESSGGEEAGD
jgi:uncharacterized protein